MFKFMYFLVSSLHDGLKIEFFEYLNENKNDAKQFNNFWRDVSLMAFLSHPIYIQRKKNEPAAQIIDGLNAIKLGAKSHLFQELKQRWVQNRQRNSVHEFVQCLLHCRKQYDITKSNTQKSFLSPWIKKLTTKQRLIKCGLKFDLNSI